VPATGHLQTTLKAVAAVFCVVPSRHPGSGLTLARDKPLQHNDCTCLAALLVNRSLGVGMSVCSVEVCFDGNMKQ